jgi:hypothetical protein
LALEPCTAPHEAKAAIAFSGLVFFFPDRRSHAGMTVQLALPPSLRVMNIFQCSEFRAQNPESLPEPNFVSRNVEQKSKLKHFWIKKRTSKLQEKPSGFK